MRVLLKIFILATAGVAWVAVSRGGIPSRAWWSSGDSPGPAEIPAAESVARPEERPVEAGQRQDPWNAPRQEAAELKVARPEIPDAEAVPVDVILVDGETGDVLRLATTAMARKPESKVLYEAAAPDGYVASVVGPRELTAWVSRRAERIRVVEPLRREADIRVRVLDAAGRPALRATVTEVLCGGAAPAIVEIEAGQAEDEPPAEVDIAIAGGGSRLPLARAAPTGADGWTRVLGVPHLLDERYWIVVAKGRSEASAEVHLRAFGERCTTEIRLPGAETRRVSSDESIGRGGGSRSGRFDGRHRREAPATLAVLVRLADGRMGGGLEVHVGYRKGVTDVFGRATFELLRPGSYAVEVRDPDFAWSRTNVDLREGQWQSLVLQEVPGWTARVTLLDSMGRPVPFARAFVSSKAPVPYLRVENGVQDLALHTDANGEICVPGMHHAPAEITFRYGSRSASVTLDEGDPSATVRLTPP